MLIEYIIVEPTEDEFKRGHKYPFISGELLNCDVAKILDFFTLTESQRLAKDRKVSSVDSDLGVSDSQLYSQVENLNTNSSNSEINTKPDDKVTLENLEIISEEVSKTAKDNIADKENTREGKDSFK